MNDDPRSGQAGEAAPALERETDAEPVDPNFWAPPPPLTVPPAPSVSAPLPASGPGEEELAGRARSRRRWALTPRSLTSRLVVGVVSLVVVLVVATSAGTYLALQSFLSDRLDQQVSQLADGNQQTLQRCLLHASPVCSIGNASSSGVRAPQRTWLAVFDAQGSSVAQITSNDEVAPLQLSADQRTAVLAHPTRLRTVTTPDGTLRISARVLELPAESVVIVSGLSNGDLHRTLSRLLLLELAIGAGAVVLAFGATAAGVRFSLRRLRGVTKTAHEVAAELSPEGAGLDRRVPVVDTDTEVGQLAESMNTLLSAVETQFAARLAHEEQMRQFLADASHELRTPLTSIRGYAELARMQGGAGSGETADNLARIESEGTRMSRLVDDLLTLARTDQGRTPLSELVDVGELVEDAVAGVRAAYPSRRVDESVISDPAVIGDRDQLLRVVRNLLTNAAVHTRADGPIGISAVREGPEVVIRVSDAGPGLPRAEADHVFERFWRADKARTRARGGSGLGLAIVASVVQAHGGSVRFDSTPETGSTVTVRLPSATG